MKKFIALLILTAIVILPACARDKIYRSADVLPTAAQQTLKKNFPKAEINRVKIDTGVFGGKDYEVVLDNGSEIEFNKDGEWTEVDCGHKRVPDGFILQSIKEYIKTNHKKTWVVKIEKSNKDYDLELSDGTELKFDRSGKFLRYDD